MTSYRLIILDKCPGIRPIGIEDIMRQLVCSILLIIADKETTRAYKKYQLCSGIEGEMYHVQSMWNAHVYDKEAGGILMIDVRYVFNEGNQKMMVSEVRYFWPSGVHFFFNMYIHNVILVIRDEKRNHFLEIKEGVAQGRPLAMVSYGLLELPLMQKLKDDFNLVESP